MIGASVDVEGALLLLKAAFLVLLYLFIWSSAIDENTEFELDSTGISIGRGGPNDVRLDADDYASANHARVEPRRDGVWIEDVGSTNGTFVNGVRLSRARKLAAGDLVRVGDTDLRFET